MEVSHLQSDLGSYKVHGRPRFCGSCQKISFVWSNKKCTHGLEEKHSHSDQGVRGSKLGTAKFFFDLSKLIENGLDFEEQLIHRH